MDSPEDILTYLRLSRRAVTLNGTILDKEADDIRLKITELNRESETEEIGLFINSTGGDTRASLRVYNAIKYSAAPVIGIIAGSCDSSAALILQACSSKLASSDNTKITLKAGHIKLSVYDLDSPRLQDFLRDFRQYQREAEIIFSLETDLSYEEVNACMRQRRGTTFQAQEALERGLITGILDTAAQ
jgi:ATP-dependent protease ClpP protease subunit